MSEGEGVLCAIRYYRDCIDKFRGHIELVFDQKELEDRISFVRSMNLLMTEKYYRYLLCAFDQLTEKEIQKAKEDFSKVQLERVVSGKTQKEIYKEIQEKKIKHWKEDDWYNDWLE